MEIDKSKIKEAERVEFKLEINDFNNAGTEVGALATARLILNLILLEPYTYPNHPLMGVGISNYLSDRVTQSNIDAITTNINMQMSTYLPKVVLTNLIVEVLDDIKGAAGQTLGILVEIRTGDTNKEVILLLSKNVLNTDINTKIYIN